MKRNRKSLQLDTQTVRSLTQQSLQRAAGGSDESDPSQISCRNRSVCHFMTEQC